jgi:replicative DNA helicase
MTTATEHCRQLLAAIIPDRRDLLDKALRHLSASHFPDRVLANLFTMLENYAGVTAAVITRPALADMLGHLNADMGTVALYQETYDLLVATRVDDSAFLWSLQEIRELAAARATGAALTHAMQILNQGVDEDGEIIRGHGPARSHVLTRFADIDRDLSMQEAPEGDMRGEADEIISDYAERKAARLSGRSVGIEFGIPALDEKITGLQNGELVLIVGYTGEGKTSISSQLGWNAAISQGRNVVILTTETLRAQIRRRLVARHSCLPHFGSPEGLNSRDIKHGTLNAEQERVLRAVVTDFTTNPGYGRCYLVQVPRAATISYIESKLLRIQRMFPVELVIMDYLALLRPERRRTSDREELGSILKEAKQLATTFNDGAGVPFVSPWQVSRTARQEAERSGFYTASALSETAEASNSADLIVSLLAPLDTSERTATVKMQVMKNRDGERANSIEVFVDYATSRFGGVTSRSPSSVDQAILGAYADSLGLADTP